jgi:hypothetical protein
MRFVGMLSMTALILTGLPPAPIGPAPAAAQSAARTRRLPPPDNDPDARCASACGTREPVTAMLWSAGEGGEY